MFTFEDLILLVSVLVALIALGAVIAVSNERVRRATLDAEHAALTSVRYGPAGFGTSRSTLTSAIAAARVTIALANWFCCVERLAAISWR